MAFEAGSQGVVVAYTIVMRSYPGVAVPFISSIVDLDDGLVLKGTLKGVSHTPSDKLFGLKVNMLFEHVTSKSGKVYWVTRFQPASVR